MQLQTGLHWRHANSDVASEVRNYLLAWSLKQNFDSTFAKFLKGKIPRGKDHRTNSITRQTSQTKATTMGPGHEVKAPCRTAPHFEAKAIMGQCKAPAGCS